MKKLLVLLLLVPSLACAQWSTDPNDPVVVVEADNDQFVDALVPDEAGGCYVIWTDYGASTDEYRIYAQHFNAGGVASWAGGLRVCTFDSKQRDADAVADGSGGVTRRLDRRVQRHHRQYRHLRAKAEFHGPDLGQLRCTRLYRHRRPGLRQRDNRRRRRGLCRLDG